MAIIRTLKDFLTGQKLYPKTLLKAVYSDDGKRLDTILNATVSYKLDEEVPDSSGDLPRDADTLGGKYTSADIDKIKGFSVPITKDVTLLASNWTENTNAGRYEYRIEDEDFTDTGDFVELIAPSTLTADQIVELMGACCYNGENGNGYVVIYCWGTVPENDIPIIVSISQVKDKTNTTQ